MTAENLYKAIGNMDERHLEDLIESETKICSQSVKSSFSGERTIVMDVVKKKKIGVKVIAVVLAAVIAAGVTAAAFLGTKKDKKIYKEKKIENYFSEDNSFILSSEISEVHKMISDDDGLFMQAYVTGKKADNYVSVYDSENDSFTELNMSGIEGTVYKMYSGKKYLWVAASDDESASSTLVCFNSETLKEETKKELEYGEYIADITEYEDGSSVFDIFRSDSGGNILEWSFCTVDSSLNETGRDVVYSENVFEEESLTSCIRNAETGEYYLYFTSWDDNVVTMYKFGADGAELYHRNDVSADMDGYPGGIYFTHNGNPSLMTHKLTGAGTDQHTIYQINEFDAETGEVINRYEPEISECMPWFVNTGWNHSDAYDFVWADNSKVYGFITSNETPEMIKDLRKYGDRYEEASLVSSGSGPLMITGPEPDSTEEGYYVLKTDKSGNIKSKKYIPSSDIEVIKRGSDGQVYAVVAEHESKSQKDRLTDKFSLCTVDSGCAFRNSVSLEIDNKKLPVIKDLAVTETAAVILMESGDGNGYNDILCFDREGKLTVSYDLKSKNSSCIFEKDGNIYAVCSSDSKSYICSVNTEKQELKEIVKLDFSTGYEAVFSEGKEGYDFLITFDDGIYGYDMEKNTLSEFINWIDSDIYFSQLEELCVTDKNRIIMGSMDQDENNSIVYNVKSFVRTDDETLKKIQNRKLINAAFLSSPDDSIVMAFRDYNRNSTEYRIHIDDYSKYIDTDNIFGLSSHLDSEIITGNIPDMIFAHSKFDWLRYSSDGMFTDIGSLMNNDPEFDRSLYFENIIDAFSFDGRQFAVPLEFRLSTLTAKKSVTGDKEGYSINELSELAENRKLFVGAKHINLLDSFILSDITEYVDFKNGECSFDTPEFVKLLELIKEQGVPDDEEIDYFTDLETGVPEDKYMFILDNLHDFKYASTEQQIYVGEEAAYAGIPSSAGSRPLVVSEFAAGITVSSENRNEAWNIIKLLLSDNTDGSIQFGEYSVNKSLFESEVQEAMKNTIVNYWPLSNGENVRIKNIDAKTVDNIRSAVERAETAALYDSGAAGIICKEFDAYIYGIQSAEETAKNIQSKMSLYLKEIK